MRSRCWRWLAGVFAAIVAVSVVLPEPGSAALAGGTSISAEASGGNPDTVMRKKRKKKKKKPVVQAQEVMQAGSRTATAS